MYSSLERAHREMSRGHELDLEAVRAHARTFVELLEPHEAAEDALMAEALQRQRAADEA